MANPENLTPWQPGQSGNPAGYSRGRRVTDTLIRLIEEKKADKALAVTWLAAALGDSKLLDGRKPDFRFFRELLDRVEGPTPKPEPPPPPAAVDVAVNYVETGRDDLDDDPDHPPEAPPGPTPDPAGDEAV